MSSNEVSKFWVPCLHLNRIYNANFPILEKSANLFPLWNVDVLFKKLTKIKLQLQNSRVKVFSEHLEAN